MSTARLRLAKEQDSANCLHCGRPSPRGAVYCCRGCEAVYAVLKERGLGDYYRLQGSASPRPAEYSEENFSFLDDESFLSAYGDAGEMRFFLEGVHCAACVWLTEKIPDFVPNVESLRLDLSEAVATVRLRTGGSFSAVARELGRFGYRPHPVKRDEADALRTAENRQHLARMGVAAAASGNIMLLAIAAYAGADGRFADAFRWMSFALYLPIVLYSAIPFYRSAWGALRARSLSIDVPIVIGILVGTAASVANLARGEAHVYFDSLSTLVFLLLATRYVLRRVQQRAMALSRVAYFASPLQARRWSNERKDYETVRTDALRAEDRVRVLPGECVPADGMVIDGESTLNCALLTGESNPRAVAPGTSVHAGTWNVSAPIVLRVSCSGAETRLGKILESVERGMTEKAPIVTHLDRVGQAFVAAVLVLCVAAFAWGAFALGDWHEGLNRALAIAIVVCPCTFALATPMAISMAIGRCAREGLLVKGADALERFSRVDCVYFDKTGTLTTGELEVVDWKEYATGALEALVALEAHSAHSIARAIRRKFHGIAVLADDVSDFREDIGRGISGVYAGRRFEVRRLRSFFPSASNPNLIESAIGVYRDDVLVGELRVDDRIRSDAKTAIRALEDLGISVGILSGDARASVEKVAQELEIERARVAAELSPERKREIVATESKVLMVGDGANDAPALAGAFASVAVRGGMEISLRAAGAFASQPGVASIPELIRIARKTFAVIRRNLVFAVLYNVIGIVVAFSGHLSPLFAAVLMPMSALTVIASTVLGARRGGAR